jgi:hypothetical protein
MKSYFLITSYTGGKYSDKKTQHLKSFLAQIKKYVKDSFIIVVDSHPVDIYGLCDIFVYKADNFNTPHGTGDLRQMNIGISILKHYGAKNFVKFNYDYWFDEKILIKYNEWKNLILTKKIVTSRWKKDNNDIGMMNSIALGFGVFQIDAAEKLFNFDTVVYPVECQLHEKAQVLFSNEEIHVYPHFMEAFGKETFDIFNDGGHNYSESRLNLINYENI